MPNTTSSSQSSRKQRRIQASSSSNTKPATSTTKTKTTGTYDRNFQQELIDHGIYPARYKYPGGSRAPKPEGWEEINRVLAQPRPSLSPSRFSDGAFEHFVDADAAASMEKQVSESVIPIIEGQNGDGRCRSGRISFSNLAPITTTPLKPGNPDIFYGARPEQLSRQIREELQNHVIPSTQHDLPIAPNFFVAVKGPDGVPVVADRQACYDGALGARGMHSLRSYGQDTFVYDNLAYTITSIYQSGLLRMYTSYPTEPSAPGERPEYHMQQLNAWAMTGNASSFRQGVAAYRNAKDWAKEQRDSAIAQANERAKAPSQSAYGSADVVPSVESESPDNQIHDDPMSQTSFTSAISTKRATSDIEGPKRSHSKREGRSRKRRT